jgi:putative ABC transport system permease protein
MKPSRLSTIDTLRAGTIGLVTRPARVVMSAMGIAIGVAAMLAVMGISASSSVDLDRTLAALGTNLLTVTPGQHVYGGQAELPTYAPDSLARIDGVTDVSAIGRINAAAYRQDHIPPGQTGSISVFAARLDLLSVVGATVNSGRWLNAATAAYPGVVLGWTAAERLGVHTPGIRIWLGHQWFSVTGILNPITLGQELDSAVFVGWPTAETGLAFDGHPTVLYVRAEDSMVEEVRGLLAATADPAHPEEVLVSRPSDALAARRATNQTMTALLTGLGAVALLVGGVGVANTMVISVLERRQEIGLRRALGATRTHVLRQFLTESMLLAIVGGLAGVFIGILVTGGYAIAHRWPTVMPWWAITGGLAATMTIGTVAGLYPAVRAARMSPTAALSV